MKLYALVLTFPHTYSFLGIKWNKSEDEFDVQVTVHHDKFL